MRDLQGTELRRGDRILDSDGNVFMVTEIGPITMHIQGVKTGRRYTIGLPQFLKMPPRQRFGKPEMTTLRERRAYFDKHARGRRR